jgi:hypothetical protein
MIVLEDSTLFLIAAFLFLIGIILVYRSFRSEKKIVLSGALGVLFLLLSGNIIIYLYSFQPIPERIIEELRVQEIPDLGLNIESRGEFNVTGGENF